MKVQAPWNGYGDLSAIIGTRYTVVLWHEPSTPLANISIAVPDGVDASSDTDAAAHATVVTFPVADAHTEDGVAIQLTHDAHA